MRHATKFKLTPQVDKQCMELSRTLPELQKFSKFGNPLYRSNTKFEGTEVLDTDSTGRPTKWKNKLKRIQEPILVNHYLELIDVYRKKGQTGIDEYVGYVRYVESRDAAKKKSA